MGRVMSGNMKLRQDIYQEALCYYQSHADEFIEDVIGIKLNLYQKILVRAFFKYSFNVWVLCRGLGKSFLGILCVVTYCILNPNTKAGIIAPAFRQAKNVLEEKYKGELCQLSAFIAQEEEKYTCTNQRARVEFFNGSWIEAFPLGSDGSKIRGARLHLVFIDETAYVPKFIIDTVVKPMMIVKRGYKVGEKQDDYAGNKVLMTSTANYRFNHLYATFIDYFKRMIQPGNTQYFAMTLPYTVGIKVGLFDEEIVKQQKEVMNDMEFQMEYLARFPKLVENAWIKYDDLQACSNLMHMETEGIKSFEYIMSIDVARIAGQDNTVIDVFKLHWFANHVEVDLIYTKSMNGETFENQAKQVRKLLIKFPQIIRIFQDTMTIGQGLTDELAKDYYDIDTNKWYPPLIDMNDETAMAAKDKTKAVPIIYGIKANPEINHRMGYAVKTFTEKGWLHLYPYQIEEDRELTLEEKTLVYETEATRMEIMNIETFGVSGGWVRFGTRSRRKDRWSAMGMGLYGARLIYEEREAKRDNTEPMFAFSKINNRRR